MPIQTRWRNSCIAPESKRQSRHRSQTTTFPNFASSYPPASHRHFGILTCSLSNEYQLLIHFIMVNRSISLLVKVQALTLTELAGFTNVAASEALNRHINASIVNRIFYRRFYKRRKSQWRPDLKAVFRFRRYHWCLQFKNWTLEDWKNVIWTDEISVIVGVRALPGT
jgi:hypothetical protein